MIWRPQPLVCGTPPLAETLATRLDARLVAPEALARLCPWPGQPLILLDPSDAETLIATLADRLAGARRPRRLILIHHRHPPPALPTGTAAGPLRIETLDLAATGARTLLARWPLHLGCDVAAGRRPHLLLVGRATPAAALLRQALLSGHYGQQHLRITLLDPDPAAAAAWFRATQPQGEAIAELRCATPETPMLAADTPVSLALICDPPRAAAHATRLRAQIAAVSNASPPLIAVATAPWPAGERAAWDGQTLPFSLIADACTPETLFTGLADQLARTIHDHYRDSVAAQGRDPDGEPGGQPWPQLAESFRAANRHQADHMLAKLAVVDCRAVPEERVAGFAFTAPEVECLARIEHQRWAADRRLDGWTHAAVRDNKRKHHPQLVDYDALSEPMKDLDRFAVRGVPTLLARAGRGIQRLLIVALVEPASSETPPPPRRLISNALGRLHARYPDRALVLATGLASPLTRALAAQGLEHPATGLWLLHQRPLSALLADCTDPATRTTLLALVARAERRLPLVPGGLAAWIERRAEIAWHPAPPAPTTRPDKRLWLTADGKGLAWDFEY
ncbi:RyR domain-containing protein [Marichromatium bheemlicum]|uniref:Ryanodine receptor Ryr n=1 Tax=Marichromatium bheemlicum TaxID=365339 RepID=A0ABX1ICE0_9GAMM|nr:RyR domain-containing protein [Marichromatium bheemlicum]NKN34586.1 Ryanodine receptor Ryr [Marichromatium bheemlicum]